MDSKIVFVCVIILPNILTERFQSQASVINEGPGSFYNSTTSMENGGSFTKGLHPVDTKPGGYLTTGGIFSDGTIEAYNIHSNQRLSSGEYLAIEGVASEGSSCAGKLLAFSHHGALLTCRGHVWKRVGNERNSNSNLNPNPEQIQNPVIDLKIVSGEKACDRLAVSRAVCPEGYTLSGGGYKLLSWKSGGNTAPDFSHAENSRTWFIRLPGIIDVQGYCTEAVANCIRIIL